MEFEAYGLSDVGLFRKNNEDNFAMLLDEHFFVLADGLGGHVGGEVASEKAVDILCNSIKLANRSTENKLDIKSASSLLRFSIEEADYRISNLGLRHKSLRGMGTTICCLYFCGESVVCAHVGDSRVYRLKNNDLERLTSDHSLANLLLDEGQVTPLEAQNFPLKNIVTRALGGHSFKKKFEGATISTKDTASGEIYMICSDGLTDYVFDDEIKDVIKKNKSAKETVHELIDLAKKNKSEDNITIIIIKTL